MPQIFNISADLPFLKALARGVLERYQNPHEVTIFLPLKRAIRSFSEEFLAASGQKAVLLPRLQAIGDVEEEELELNFADIPPQIPPLKRLYRLARHINEFEPDFARALSLASSYTGLIDEVQNAGLDMSAFSGVVPEEYAIHWQRTVDFLTKVSDIWQEYLKNNNLIEPVERRNRILQRVAENLGQGPVIIAGSSGSIKATAELMKNIYNRENGAVVLHGLDEFLADDDFAMLDETHPQKNLSNLLKLLGLKKSAVEKWQESTPSARQQIISSAMLPSFKTDQWQGKKHNATDIKLIEAAGTEDESLEIAFLLRRALQEQKTAFVVTNNRDLARKVSAKMKMWDVDINDSTFTMFLYTPEASFIISLAQMLVGRQAPLDVLCFFKHQFIDPATRQKIEEIEHKHLRGPRPEEFKVQDHGIDFEGLTELEEYLRKNKVCLKTALQKLLELAARISAQMKDSEDLQDVLPELEFDEGHQIDPLMLPEILRSFFASRRMVSKWVQNPNINIYSPIEARLQSADTIILAGLNEGSLPEMPASDSFLSQSIRKNIGLELLHKKIGQQAHDFELLATSPNIVLTRSLKEGGAAQLKSRFLERLQAVAELDVYQSRAEEFYEPGEYIKLPRPAPRPPKHARPSQIYATSLGRLMRDPYVFYAREILRLKKLNDVDQDITGADFGTFIHAVLEEYTNTRANIYEIGRKLFEPYSRYVGATSFWWPKFLRIAAKYLELESTAPALAESIGEYTTGGITFKAKADRVEVTDSIKIIDFKTGSPPKPEHIQKGLEPQLTLEAIIFAHKHQKPVSGLEYWYLKGRDKVIDIKQVPLETVEITRESLPVIAAKITDENTPFLARPWSYYALKYNDYEHLERIKEWDS